MVTECKNVKEMHHLSGEALGKNAIQAASHMINGWESEDHSIPLN